MKCTCSEDNPRACAYCASAPAKPMTKKRLLSISAEIKRFNHDVDHADVDLENFPFLYSSLEEMEAEIWRCWKVIEAYENDVIVIGEPLRKKEQ